MKQYLKTMLDDIQDNYNVEFLEAYSQGRGQ